MKKIAFSIIIVMLIITAVGSVLFLVDYNRVMNNKKPIFAVNITGVILDGGTTEYYGLGYKVIDFNTISGYDDIKIGTWFIKYDDFYNEMKMYENNL